MAANQVVLYFDKQEDALLFTLAASSVMSAEGPAHARGLVDERGRERAGRRRSRAEKVVA